MAIPYEAIIGMITGAFSEAVSDADRREQQDQQKRLNWDQTQNQMWLGKYNQQLAMQTWRDTNYSAQLEELKKAGLNPGLIYKQGGPGGQLLGNQAGNSVQGAMAIPNQKQMSMQFALEAAMATAQIKNIQANTQKTKVETEKTAGVDTAAAAAAAQNTTVATEKLKAEIKNTEVQNGVLQAQKELTELQKHIMDKTQVDLINQVAIINDKLYGEAQSALTKANVDQTTRENAIQLIQQSTIEQQVRIGTMKSNIQVNSQQIAKIATEIKMMVQNNMREWDKMSQTDKEIAIKQKIAQIAETTQEFNTSGAAQIRQWTSVITDIVGSITGAGSAGSRPIGFQY